MLGSLGQLYSLDRVDSLESFSTENSFLKAVVKAAQRTLTSFLKRSSRTNSFLLKKWKSYAMNVGNGPRGLKYRCAISFLGGISFSVQNTQTPMSTKIWQQINCWGNGVRVDGSGTHALENLSGTNTFII